MTWEYEALRQLADSWGLILTGAVFATLVGWTFRRGANRDHAHAARTIFEPEDNQDG